MPHYNSFTEAWKEYCQWNANAIGARCCFIHKGNNVVYVNEIPQNNSRMPGHQEVLGFGIALIACLSYASWLKVQVLRCLSAHDLKKVKSKLK